MENLYSKLDFLFSQDFFSDEFDPEGEYPNMAIELLNKNDWEDIFSICVDIFTNKYRNPSGLYNVLNLHSIYTFSEKKIPNPYHFIGYILYIIDLNRYSDEYGDFIETLIIAILDNSLDTNYMGDGYYCPWEDSKITEAVEYWKNKDQGEGEF